MVRLGVVRRRTAVRGGGAVAPLVGCPDALPRDASGRPFASFDRLQPGLFQHQKWEA